MDAPNILGASQDGFAAKVYWSPVPDALEYEYRRGTGAPLGRTGKSWIVLRDGTADKPKQVPIGEVQIRALGADGASAWVPAVAPQQPATPPSTPTPPPKPAEGSDAPPAPAGGDEGSD